MDTPVVIITVMVLSITVIKLMRVHEEDKARKWAERVSLCSSAREEEKIWQRSLAHELKDALGFHGISTLSLAEAISDRNPVKKEIILRVIALMLIPSSERPLYYTRMTAVRLAEGGVKSERDLMALMITICYTVSISPPKELLEPYSA